MLAAQGEPVRVIARNPEKVAALSQAGVEVVKGDLEVPASIDAALRDVSSVILVSLAIPNQELVVVTSAVRADVDHVVKITSKASADSPIARRRGQTEIEERLIASGLGYTLLRNNVYMQNFLMLAPAIVKTSDCRSTAPTREQDSQRLGLGLGTRQSQGPARNEPLFVERWGCETPAAAAERALSDPP